jgi:hypothetical protein
MSIKDVVWSNHKGGISIQQITSREAYIKSVFFPELNLGMLNMYICMYVHAYAV